MRLSRVVFPAPKNPLRTVTGTVPRGVRVVAEEEEDEEKEEEEEEKEKEEEE